MSDTPLFIIIYKKLFIYLQLQAMQPLLYIVVVSVVSFKVYYGKGWEVEDVDKTLSDWLKH